jgi:hypothetical protein
MSAKHLTTVPLDSENSFDGRQIHRQLAHDLLELEFEAL